jgi:hypothetical protein
VRWCYGGWRWSCDGEEGEEGELKLHERRTVRGGGWATLTAEKLATAEAATAATTRLGQRRSGRLLSRRHMMRSGGGRRERGCRSARREAVGGCAGERCERFPN